MKIDEITSVLRGIVGDDNLLVAPLPGDYEVDGVQPKVVVSPNKIEVAAEVLAAAHRERWVVIPRGGGTAMHLGNVPSGADIILSTLRLDAPVVHNPADLTASAQAGTPIATLQEKLGENGQFLPVDPPYSTRATLGGIVAASTFGPNRQGYGTVRDQVLGVTVIHADGTISHGGGQVVKNVAGYDMTRLYIGSLGSLGVIAEVNLRLRPCAETRRSVMGLFPTAAAAYRAFAAIFRSELIPTAFALLNPTALDAPGEDAKGDPSGGGYYSLIVGCEETAAAVDREIAQIGRVLREHKGEGVREVAGREETELWEAVRHLPFQWSPGPDDEEAETLLCRASVPTSRVADMMEATEAVAAGKSLACLLSSYIGAGVLYCCLGLPGSGLDAREYVDVVRRLRELARDREGNVVVERAPLSVKQQLDVWGEVGSTLPVMQAIKGQFDPDGILNPGRFVGRL